MNAYVVAVIVSVLMLVLDFVWLSLNGPSYRNMFAKVQGQAAVQFNMVYATAAYAVMVISVFMFVVPGMKAYNGSLKGALLHGLLFGFVIYAIYNFTNAATLKNWDPWVMFKDIIWGSCLYFILALTSGFLLSTR